MTKLINLGCTANEGRSKPSEIFGNTRLKEVGKDSEYKVISSGTLADAIVNEELSPSVMMSIIDMARTMEDIYSADDLVRIDKAIRKGDDDAIKDFYRKAYNQLSHEEHQYRAEVLAELGIEQKVKEPQDQTVARPDAIAVLTMGQNNNAQAVQIHEAAGYVLAPEQPEIGQTFVKDGCEPVLVSVLSAYVTGDPKAEAINAFGKDKATYKAGIMALQEQVPMAIDKLVADR